MELKQLEYFLAVSNNKSFTRAAEQLYVSQPSVTTAIKKLEDELGLILFDRNKKQAILTSEGEIFYQHAGHRRVPPRPARCHREHEESAGCTRHLQPLGRRPPGLRSTRPRHGHHRKRRLEAAEVSLG